MEWAAGWSKIAASTARERPGAALAVAASVAAALPVMLVALVFAAVAFAALALPLGIATAAWWVTLRPRARGRDSPSSILTRLREGTLRLSSVPEGSAEPGSARGSLASPRASLTPAGLGLGNPPVDLLVVYAGSTESDAAPGRDFFDAARMVAARIKEKLEAQHERVTNEKKNEEFVVALANAAWLARDASATELATTLADFADAVVFVVESSSSSVSSSASRALRKKLQGEIKARHGGSAEAFFASTRRKACAPFCAVTISWRGRETSERGDGASSAPRRAGGFAVSDDFDKAMGDLLLVDSGETTNDVSRDSLSRVTHQEKKVSSSRRLCESCDFYDIERNGPGALDRWTREVLFPALKDPSALKGPTPPRVLCLSSTHTNLLLRHLDARHLVVGCEPWYEDTEDTEGETEPKAAPIPRVDPLKLDLDEIKRLDPTLVVCAYESVADALRKFGPKWDVPDAERSIAEKRSSGKDLSFEVVVLECPLGRDALERAAAQIVELARVTRVDAGRARAAADTLRFGILEIRAKAERAFGGDFARSVSSSSRRDGETDRLETPSRPQPFVFIEADPLLYSADSCTPLGAALAEGLGVGNVADADVSARRDAEKETLGARVSARAAAALAKRMGRDVGLANDTAYDDDDDSTKVSSQHTHYPRLPAHRFWNPREPDWWIVAHPTNGGASGTSFADSLDAEDRDRHAALREGRVVNLSDALCHAASQWTPELVDVVEAVFQKMLEKARKTDSASEEVAHSAPRGTGTETKKEKTTKKDAEASRGTAEESESCEEPFVDASDVFDARFRDRNLRALPPSALSLDLPPLRLTSLDLSRNELSELPGLAALAPTLRVLTLERNWFSRVPAGVGALRALEELNLSRNFLRPGDDALALDALRSLKRLRVLDLRWNRKVCTAETSRRLSRALGGDSSANDAVSAGTEIVFEQVDVRVTISFPAPAGAFVGSSPADRDASCLRAQLEPWSTLALRRRLVEDFGEDPESVEDPEEVPRSLVVARLLAAYEREGLVEVAEEAHHAQEANDDKGKGGTPNASDTNAKATVSAAADDEGAAKPPQTSSASDTHTQEASSNKGVARRRAVRVRGAPVSAAALDDLNALLRAWLERRLAKGAKGNVQERPSVNAKAYMILRSPTDFNAKLGAGSRKARQAADKFAAHEALWRAAERALREVDPGFADAFTALAVTYGFQGSPHIDKQNVGPFYGLALGDFDDDTGGVVVEADARTVCVVDTKHRLGKVDGRFPHWVAPWDVKSKERFSLIYYRTMGEPEPITSAAFDERGVGVHVDQDLSEGSSSGEERGDE